MKLIKKTFLPILALLLIGLYHVSVSQIPAQFLGFEKIEWENCPIHNSNYLVQGNNRFRVAKLNYLDAIQHCKSKPIGGKNAKYEFEYRGVFDEFSSSIIFPDSQKSEKIIFTPSKEWQTIKFNLDTIQNFQIYFNPSRTFSDKGNWIEVRSRINVFAKPPFTEKFKDLKNHRSSKIIISILGSIGIIFSFVFLNSRQFSNKVYFLVFFIISLLVHFRFQNFFYFDAWHILQRFSEQGISGIIYSHNEHFLPLFFLFYYLESVIFGSQYELFLIISHLLHSLNTLLIVLILKEVLPKTKKTNAIALVLGILFLVNSNHAEALQWSFIQSVLLAHAAIFTGLYFCLKYLKEKHKYALRISYISLGLSPFFFANGFISPALIILFTGAYFLPRKRISELKDQLSAARNLIGKTLFILLFAAFAYYSYGISSEANEISIHSQLQFSNIIRYIASGTLLGTILRSIGLFPSLHLEGLEILSKKLPAPLLELAKQFSSLDAFFWTISLLVCFFLFLTTKRKEQTRENLILFFIGFIWIICFFVLPALGRAQFGPSQALALRYHYGSIFGLLLILSPFISFLFEKPKLLVSCSLFVLSVHLYSEAGYSKYSDLGITNRTYIAKLRNWRKKIGTNEDQSFRFDAKGTKWHGQQPRWTSTLTTGVNSEIIYDTLKLLEREEDY